MNSRTLADPIDHEPDATYADPGVLNIQRDEYEQLPRRQLRCKPALGAGGMPSQGCALLGEI